MKTEGGCTSVVVNRFGIMPHPLPRPPKIADLILYGPYELPRALSKVALN